MKTVYRAANSLEAHIVLNLLRQAGIEGHISGEYLQGAMGELPAVDLVRVMVHEGDYDEALDIIAARPFTEEDAGTSP
jgi:hypothetical protein